MTAAELIAQPFAVPVAVLLGAGLGSLLTWPVSYLKGKADAQSEEIAFYAARRDKYIASNLHPPEAT